MKSYSRAYNRDISRRKAKRKQKIAKEIYHGYPYYDNLNQFSKNKIHCSCPWCNSKSRNKGRRRTRQANYQRSLNWNAADTRKLIAMDEDEFEILGIRYQKRRRRW